MLLEVERKFCPSAAGLITCNAGSPPFRQILRHRRQVFRDVYYDHGRFLRNAGVWLRRRNKRWEAKLKVGGDYKYSQFQEVKGKTAIDAAIAKHLQGLISRTGPRHLDLPLFLGACRIEPVADIETMRDSWTADDEYTIVIDTTDFGHTVGEVELEHNHPELVQEDAKNDMLKQMDQKIAVFMQRYAWAFPSGQCKGKLTAFFEWKNRATEQKPFE
ncbi:CYTH-like domain-containing protein [Exophiala viscosa]|uniref:CYTH-like domain-containing protein n=1 Tax=Exophiala viscosa TaxID=2486360 RepID=A0AAN6I9N8_9EURO|nr:CYTH-like domain-containing protein [Exophiala viscosa]KAI1620660.1 CYTH-like domain-containing protein [Exophiala viscosa]